MAKQPFVKEVTQLRKIFLDAENDIIKLVERQRTNNFVDYSSVAQLERVQNILKQMVDKSFRYIPKAVEKQFYQSKRAFQGYKNAGSITSQGYEVIKHLVDQLENQVVKASIMAGQQFTYQWQQALTIGRLKPDAYRKAALKANIKSEATGSLERAHTIFLNDLQEQGITGFIDKLGRKYTLEAYCMMAARTTALQARNLSMIDNDWDLYMVAPHQNSCPVCKPFEGRVYSKSGLDPNYPPLASAFGKIDKSGPNTLENTYLCIHPNCLHTLVKFTERGKTNRELQTIRNRSSFEKNPPAMNKLNAKELKAWQNKTKGEQQLNADWKQWSKYKDVLGSNVPHFETFLKHKMLADDKYKSWVSAFRKANK